MLRDVVEDEEEYLGLVRELVGGEDDVKAAERSTTRASARRTAAQVGRGSMIPSGCTGNWQAQNSTMNWVIE